MSRPMTEQELWLVGARNSIRRAHKLVALARRAQEDHNLLIAFARDATLTPLEAAYAGNALDDDQ